MKVVGAAALAAFVLAGAGASAAERAFPGRNGSLAFGGGTDREIPAGVFVVRSDGSDLRRLTPSRMTGVSLEAPDWSPDGRTVFYASASADLDVVGCGPGFDTVTADRRHLVGEDCERV